MAPQFGPDAQTGPNGQNCIEASTGAPCDSSIRNSSTTSSVKQLNVPMLALGLGLASFLLICLIVCACTYRNAKARNRASRDLVSQQRERGQHEYSGLGLGLQVRDRSPVIILKDGDTEIGSDDQAPPAYSPKPSPSPSPSPSRLNLSAGIHGSRSPLLSVSPLPTLAAPVSPALSSYTLSPALSQGESEEVGLLGGRRALTPPPPTYVR